MANGMKSGRRNFLNWLLGGTSVTFLAALTYPVLKFLTPPPSEDSAVQAVEAGKVDEFPSRSGKIVKFGNKPVLVIRDTKGEFHALLAVCTHLDCTVQFLPEESIIWCACHNGKYDLNGTNISGPPPKPLTALQVNIREGQVFISREA